MGLWRSWSGTRKIELTSADPSGAMNALLRRNITVLEPTLTDRFTWQFYVSYSDCSRVRNIIDQRGEVCTIGPVCGIQGMLKQILSRPILLIGWIILIILTFWIPERLFFIQVEGNSLIPTNQIMEALYDAGVCFGANTSDIRSEQVKNSLMNQLPQLQWAGVTLRGCVAYIRVDEKTKTEADATQADGVASILAATDGIILDMTVLKGTALCQPGQAVLKGQTLISGYTDCGICIQACYANGQVIAQTNRKIKALIPLTWRARGGINQQSQKISVIIGKKLINFSKDSGILDAGCVKMYEQKSITLPGGFVLPISVLVEKTILYDQAESSSEMEEHLRSFARTYIAGQMTAGTIEKAQEVFSCNADVCLLQGSYWCVENIGVVRMEENLPNYGKNNGKNGECGIH